MTLFQSPMSMLLFLAALALTLLGKVLKKGILCLFLAEFVLPYARFPSMWMVAPPRKC